MTPTVSVITGDIIRSTRSSSDALEHTMSVLSAAAAALDPWSSAPTRFTRFRGDGWQIVIGEHEYALRAALFIHARLRADPLAMGSRMAIGFGPLDYHGTADLSDARGAAFALSGRGLDEMSSLRLLSLHGEGLTTLHPVVVELLEQHIRKWTRDQAEAAALALHPDNPTLQDMAPQLGISPQAVNYRLSGGSVQAIRHALTAWEDAFAAFVLTGKWTP